MNRFIESFATQQLLPPYRSEGVMVHCFLFRLSTRMVQGYCDRFLNLGPLSKRPFHYTALDKAPIGILSIAQYPRIATVILPTSQIGLPWRTWDNVTQNELYAAAPVLRHRVVSGGVLVEPTLEWIQPFLLIDNASSTFSGREILGLEVLHGDFAFAPKPDGGISIDTVLPSWSVFSPNSVQAIEPFLSVETGSPLSAKALDAVFAEAAQDPGSVADMAALQEAIPEVDRVSGGAIPAAMRMVILKQFRDAADATKAIYQSLVSARCRFSNVAQFEVYSGKDCRLTFTDGAMVNQIIGALLDVPEAKLNAEVDASGAATQTRELEARMGFSFTATVDFDQISTTHSFAA